MPSGLRKGKVPPAKSSENPLGISMGVAECNTLRKLAEEIRNLYQQKRMERYPQNGRIPRTQDTPKIWWKAAKMVHDSNGMASELVRCTFEAKTNPMPNDLIRQDVQKAITELKEYSRDWAKDDVRLMTQMLRQQIEVKGKTPQQVIESGDHYFNPLFLYVVAYRSNLFEHMKKLERSASLFAESHEDYRNVLHDWLPDQMKQKDS